MASVYLTALGKFLPGSPIGNDEMEDHVHANLVALKCRSAAAV